MRRFPHLHGRHLHGYHELWDHPPAGLRSRPVSWGGEHHVGDAGPPRGTWASPAPSPHLAKRSPPPRPLYACAISPERVFWRWATLRGPATWQSIRPGPLKCYDERPSSARSGATLYCGVRWFRALARQMVPEWLARGALAHERRSRPYLHRRVSAAGSSSHAAVSRSSSCSSMYSSGRALRSDRLP